MKSNKSANTTDRYVGSRVRMRRLTLGLTQEGLGEALDVTFQQVQKYEKGTNRIGSSRLQQLSEKLGVPVGWFFEGMPGLVKGVAIADPLAECGATRDGTALVKAFNAIDDVALRSSLVTLAEAMVVASSPAHKRKAA